MSPASFAPPAGLDWRMPAGDASRGDGRQRNFPQHDVEEAHDGGCLPNETK